MSCDTCVEAIHTPGRPAPWCVPALECIANSLLRTRNVGSPHASTSWASGSLRQISRNRESASREPPADFTLSVAFAAVGFLAVDFLATDFLATDFLAADFFDGDFFADCLGM